MSDVEETIMIVDLPEGAPEGQGIINVSIILLNVKPSSDSNFFR